MLSVGIVFDIQIGQPYLEDDVAQLDTVSADSLHAGPVLINVERVGVAVTDEVLED